MFNYFDLFRLRAIYDSRSDTISTYIAAYVDLLLLNDLWYDCVYSDIWARSITNK